MLLAYEDNEGENHRAVGADTLDRGGPLAIAWLH